MGTLFGRLFAAPAKAVELSFSSDIGQQLAERLVTSSRDFE